MKTNDELTEYLFGKCEINDKGEKLLDIDLFAEVLEKEKGYNKNRVKGIIYLLAKEEKLKGDSNAKN